MNKFGILITVKHRDNFHALQDFLFERGLYWWGSKDQIVYDHSIMTNSISVNEFLEGEGLELGLVDECKINKYTMPEYKIEKILKFEDDKKEILEWIGERKGQALLQ